MGVTLLVGIHSPLIPTAFKDMSITARWLAVHTRYGSCPCMARSLEYGEDSLFYYEVLRILGYSYMAVLWGPSTFVRDLLHTTYPLCSDNIVSSIPPPLCARLYITCSGRPMMDYTVPYAYFRFLAISMFGVIVAECAVYLQSPQLLTWLDIISNLDNSSVGIMGQAQRRGDPSSRHDCGQYLSQHYTVLYVLCATPMSVQVPWLFSREYHVVTDALDFTIPNLPGCFSIPMGLSSTHSWAFIPLVVYQTCEWLI